MSGHSNNAYDSIDLNVVDLTAALHYQYVNLPFDQDNSPEEIQASTDLVPLGEPALAVQALAEAHVVDQDVEHSESDIDMENDTSAGFEAGFDDNPFLQDINAFSDEEDDAWFQQQGDESLREIWNNLHTKSQFRKARLGIAMILVQKQDAKMKSLTSKIREQGRKINELTALAEHITRRGTLLTEVTWSCYLKLFLLGEVSQLPFDLTSYEKIYKRSCRESNIAPHPRQLIPGLELIPPGLTEVPAVQPVYDLQQFNFEGLSPKVQFRILQHALCFHKQRIHVLSRLDPYQPPVIDNDDLENADFLPSLLHRFHVGDEPVSLTNATLPSVLLAPLLVCKKFNFWGASIFYGENRFTFSSLGE
ncbi:hypothetical protein E4U21_000369 [Claviceps maximensis]|nr:hypothetical protein E4U21_000369 [Claviceps maximensis]